MRFGEKEWKDTLDQWIGAHEREVQAILASYRVPLLDAQGDLIAPREFGANTPTRLNLKLENQVEEPT